MEAYIKLQAKKIEYSIKVIQLNEFETGLQKEIRIFGSISSDIYFYKNSSSHNIKFANFYLENKKKI